jgi:hypothetical protein
MQQREARKELKVQQCCATIDILPSLNASTGTVSRST